MSKEEYSHTNTVFFFVRSTGALMDEVKLIFDGNCIKIFVTTSIVFFSRIFYFLLCVECWFFLRYDRLFFRKPKKKKKRKEEAT